MPFGGSLASEFDPQAQFLVLSEYEASNQLSVGVVGWKCPCSAGPWFCLPCGERVVGASVEFRFASASTRQHFVAQESTRAGSPVSSRLPAMPSMPQQVHALSCSLELLLHKVETMEARTDAKNVAVVVTSLSPEDGCQAALHEAKRFRCEMMLR